jgi:hypothetical protein
VLHDNLSIDLEHLGWSEFGNPGFHYMAAVAVFSTSRTSPDARPIRVPARTAIGPLVGRVRSTPPLTASK